MHNYNDSKALVAAVQPDESITLVRPHAAKRAARYFLDNFPGKSLYAVKANPSPDLIKLFWDEGITHFDVASIGEVRLVKSLLPESVLCFMHPVKSESAIAEAYHVHGVRTFSLDTVEELDKIKRATKDAQDLILFVRIRVSSKYSEISLAAKFGAEPEDVAELLMAARQSATRLGICFHVGSQTMTPLAYSDAMEHVRAAIVQASVTVDIINVGGGFPSSYPGMEPPALSHYFELIDRSYEDLPISYSAELWCEPGRALCAEYASLVVKVEKRRGSELFINDGAYGALFDAAHIGWRFPVEHIGRNDKKPAELVAFSFYGPTCDDLDHMVGPFHLPDNIAAGDYIEIGLLGAYGCAMRTSFNGFVAGEIHVAHDEPMATLYGVQEKESRDNVISLSGANIN